MGSSVGPALAEELISQLGNEGIAIQGVDYSATIESNASMGADVSLQGVYRVIQTFAHRLRSGRSGTGQTRAAGSAKLSEYEDCNLGLFSRSNRLSLCRSARRS